MEVESFEDIKIAQYLNHNFITIKVDREQLPAVDSYYMRAMQRINGSGGWPMSVFLMPDKRAFHAETYMPSKVFLQRLQTLNNLWQHDNKKIVNFATSLHNILNPKYQPDVEVVKLDKTIFTKTINNALANFDELQGGFRQAPKFPSENLLLFLLEQNHRQPNAQLTTALTVTLSAMAQGGIYDQVGGGFHRYSTDNAWLVPHFEKMLYNQAMLIRVYSKGWQLTKNPFYQRIALQTADYLVREMLDESAGFYAATDADSGEGEGEYFVWTPAEIKQILSKSEAKLLHSLYDVSNSGNFEGHNILAAKISFADFAADNKITLPALFNKLDKINLKLLKFRNSRPKPFLDKKIITAWNSLTITAFVELYATFGQEKYLKIAETTANLIMAQFHNGNLPRILTDKIQGTLSDYAYLLEAIIALYDQTNNRKYLEFAKLLVAGINTNFLDHKTGDYFLNQANTGMPQIKDPSDSAIYSATAALYRSLLQLYRRSGDVTYQDAAAVMLANNSAQISQYPLGYAYFLSGLANKLQQENQAIRYAALGHLRLHIKKIVVNNYLINIKMDKSWHINSQQPLTKNLIATKLVSADNSPASIKVIYPPAELIKLGVQINKMSLFQDEINIKFTSSNKTRKVLLTLQACDDKNCLAPEKLNFNLPAQ